MAYLLTLSSEEGAALKASLEAYLVDLRRETAASDAREVQHALAERQRHLEAILGCLLIQTETPPRD